MKRTKAKRGISLFLVLIMCLAFLPAVSVSATTDYAEGVTVKADPDSPTGYTVTFVYKNDAATSVEMVSPHMRFMKTGSTGSNATAYYPVDAQGNVTWTRDMYLVGNDSAPFRINMLKDENDLWTVSVPLPSGSYSYQYRLNGSTLVEDPANPGLHPPAPHAADPHSLVGVPFDPEKQDYDFSFGAPMPGVPEGTVEFLTYEYEGPGTTSPTKHVAVYLPPNFDKNRAEPYKVQIVSHGMGGWEAEWMHKGKIPVMMNNLIATGVVEPYIVVSVNNTQFNFTSGDNTASVVDATLNYLMPILVERYNVSTNPKDRAYSGYSYGGHITSRVMRNAATEFGYFGMWSGADQNITVATWQDKIVSLPEADKPVVMYSMGVNDQLRAAFGGDQFRNRLTEAGVDFGDYSNWPGGHDWMFWHRSFFVFATEYLWKEDLNEGATVKADPDSPTGFTVTFVYKNENATAVRLAGDLTLRGIGEGTTRFQPEDWKTGRYHAGGTEFTRAMTNVGNGYWTVSIPMTAGGLSYWYRVDDPTMTPATNKRIWDPAASHPRPEDSGSVTTYRTVNNDVLGAVYVPYDAKQNDSTLESRAKYELPAAVQGTVTYVPYTPWTPAEYPNLRQPGETYYLGVYLPPDYDENRAEPYPVVYLNHGVYGDETDWMVPGNAPNIIDNLIAAGEIEPTVLVTVGNHYSTVPQAGGGMPENGYNPPTAAKNIVNAILPFMEANYNVSAEPSGRAVGGFSYGGTTTWNVMYDYADLFGYFGFFSAAGSLNTAQLDKIQEKAAGAPRFALIGNGIFEGALSNSGRDSLRSIGFESETHQVPGAHDMMTAGQLFTIFAKDYLWELEEPTGVQSVRALTDMGWWGQRVTGVVLEFSEEVDASKLKITDFAVRDTSFNPYFDSGSQNAESFMRDQTVVDVYTVADPQLLLDNDRPAAPGKYVVVMVLPNFNGGTKVSISSGMKQNPNMPTQVSFSANIIAADGDLLARPTAEPLRLDGYDDTPVYGVAPYTEPIVNRKYDKFIHEIETNPSVGLPLNYDYRLPDNYDPNKKYPLVVYFNGQGQGYYPVSDNIKGELLCDGTPYFFFNEMLYDAEKDKTYAPCPEEVIYLAPQSTRTGQTTAQQAEQACELIENFSKRFSVDTQRIHLYALSGGTALCWWATANRGDLFATVMPTGMSACTVAQAEQIAAQDSPPRIWLYQGQYDHLFGAVTAVNSNNYLRTAYAAQGYTDAEIDDLVKLTLVPDVDFEPQGPGLHTPSGGQAHLNPDLPGPRIDRHAPMVAAFQNPAVSAWMFAQRKPLVMTEGPTVTADPNSPTGYSVTFVYKNENATRVQLAGDLGLVDLDDVTPTSAPNTLPRYQLEDWKEGRFSVGGVEWRHDMVNDGNGYWSVTIPLHAGGLSYWYRVDDPTMTPATNKRIWDPATKHPRPPAGFSWRERRNDVLDVVYVPYDAKQNDPTLESRATYQLPRANPDESGSVQYVPYTAIDDSTAYLGVYLPPGYDENRAEPYPVMYLAHGGSGDETDWMIPGNAPYVMDNAIARGEIEPTILVSMGYSFLSGGMAGATNNMINRILPYMEANYNVSKEGDRRAYGGFSNGASYGDMLLEEYTEMFGYFGYFSTIGAKNLNFSKIASAEKVPFVHVGNGIFESSAYKSNMSNFYKNLQSAGIPSAYYQFNGAHDMMTASQQFTTFVKNHLWKPVYKEGATVVADPNSPTGYTVTFVYKNENATSVKLAGDLTQRDVSDTGAAKWYQPEDWQTGRYHVGGTEFTRAMTKDENGYWSVSIPMHAGGLSYWYRVDDPTQEWVNKRIWDPTATHPRPPAGHSYRETRNDVLGAVYVPYSEKQNDPVLEERAIYELPAADPAQRGTVTYVPYTNINGVTDYIGVYLPAGYDPDRAESYKVMYLSHGIFGDETDWMVPGNGPNILDNMIARGEIEPTILVTTGNHMLPNRSYNTTTAANNIATVVIPFMEANYNVSTERDGRAYGGFSMGGMTGGPMMNLHADKFAYYGFFSGSPSGPNYNTIASLVGDNKTLVMLGNGSFEGALTSFNTVRDNLRNVGIDSETHQVPGAHDMMTAGQLFTLFAKEYLWKIEEEPKVDAAITSVVSTIVAGYAANLPAEVVFNGEPVSFELGLFDPNGKLLSTMTVSANGKYTFKLDAADAIAGTYTIKAVSATGGVSINCVAQPTDLWTPKVTVVENTITVTFAADVTFNASKKGVKIEGVSIDNNEVSVSGGIVTITGATAAQGQQIVISGVKYAELFPSYSFTFTILVP